MEAALGNVGLLRDFTVGGGLYPFGQKRLLGSVHQFVQAQFGTLGVWAAGRFCRDFGRERVKSSGSPIR